MEFRSSIFANFGVCGVNLLYVEDGDLNPFGKIDQREREREKTKQKTVGTPVGTFVQVGVKVNTTQMWHLKNKQKKKEKKNSSSLKTGYCCPARSPF